MTTANVSRLVAETVATNPAAPGHAAALRLSVVAANPSPGARVTRLVVEIVASTAAKVAAPNVSVSVIT